jgi:hypothetical protein
LRAERAARPTLGTCRITRELLRVLEREDALALRALRAGHFPEILEQPFRDVDDRVQRGAKLVGDARDELPLGPGRGLGALEREGELVHVARELRVQALEVDSHHVDAICEAEREQGDLDAGAD